MNILLLLAGLAVLTYGADLFVKAASGLARHLGLTPLVIGLTVVAFGTSAPELVVSIGAALDNAGDVAVGNVVGSNIFNIGVILGLSAMVCPIAVRLSILRLDMPLVLAASLGTTLLLAGGHIGRIPGTVLILLLAGYTWFSIAAARRETSAQALEEFEAGVPGACRKPGTDLLLTAVGLTLLIGGGRLFVTSSTQLAHALGISEAVIGLTIVAAGTSMPELATSIVAALRRQPDIALGNIVGSNLFNILGILGISALVRPLDAPGIRMADAWVMTAYAAALLPLLWTGKTLHRWEGALLAAGYGVYLYLLWP